MVNPLEDGELNMPRIFDSDKPVELTLEQPVWLSTSTNDQSTDRQHAQQG